MFQQTVDTLGNIFDAAGNHIGVQAGSVADIGAKGTKPTSNSSTPTVAAPTDPTATDWGNLKDWSKNHPFGQATKGVGDLVTGVLHPLDTVQSFIFTSRLIFLVIGLLLIGAGLMQFRVTQTVIETGTKAAKLGAKLAA
jgi:hypothetical protein